MRPFIDRLLEGLRIADRPADPAWGEIAEQAEADAKLDPPAVRLGQGEYETTWPEARHTDA